MYSMLNVVGITNDFIITSSDSGGVASGGGGGGCWPRGFVEQESVLVEQESVSDAEHTKPCFFSCSLDTDTPSVRYIGITSYTHHEGLPPAVAHRNYDDPY